MEFIIGNHYEDDGDIYVVVDLREDEIRIKWADSKYEEWFYRGPSFQGDIPRPDLDKHDIVQKDLEDLLK